MNTTTPTGPASPGQPAGPVTPTDTPLSDAEVADLDGSEDPGAVLEPVRKDSLPRSAHMLL